MKCLKLLQIALLIGIYCATHAAMGQEVSILENSNAEELPVPHSEPTPKVSPAADASQDQTSQRPSSQTQEARQQSPQTRASQVNRTQSRATPAAANANSGRAATRSVLPIPGRPANLLLIPVRPVPVVVVGGRFGRTLAIPAPPIPPPPFAPAFVTGRGLAPAPIGGGRGVFRRR